MKYLGVYFPEKHAFYAGDYHITPARTVCMTDAVEEQRTCSKYQPCTGEEKNRLCQPAPEFACIFCECGCSDLCEVNK